tara:strand:- start:333 stop:545 length:213 start_codon:yes stop_codon:yes gene_type:complete
MAQETIKYTVRQDGNVTQEVINVEGTVCVKLTEDMEINLGDLEKRTYTVDYYKEPNLNQDITINTNDVSL